MTSATTTPAVIAESAIRTMAEEILAVLPNTGQPVGNASIKALLARRGSVSEACYGAAKQFLLANRHVRSGPGRGGTLAKLVASEPPTGNLGSTGPRHMADSPEPTVVARRLIPLDDSRQPRPRNDCRQESLFPDLSDHPETRIGIDEPHLSEQIITYIGNKRALIPFIGRGLERARQRLGTHWLRTFDVFSGSGIVARYLKPFSSDLSVCDLESYSAVINSCYLSNPDEIDHALVRHWIDRLNDAGERGDRPGFISELYAPQDDSDIKPGERVFYTRRNARFIDTARALIDDAPESIRPHLLAPLLYVASVHANTSGVFKGFYKNSDTGIGQFGGNGRDALTRICKPIAIPYPIYSPRRCSYTIYSGDSNQLAAAHPEVDVAYLDPPHNQHPYGSNYFMLNLIASRKRPDCLSHVSGIPQDWNRSAYNKRALARAALHELASSLRARFLLISFNSEGFISKQDMLDMLAGIGRTEVLETSYNTFRGSRNLAGRKTYVTEYLYLVEKHRHVGQATSAFPTYRDHRQRCKKKAGIRHHPGVDARRRADRETVSTAIRPRARLELDMAVISLLTARSSIISANTPRIAS